MIPKTINYCWFGKNSFSSLNEKCIDSWREKCPDYKVIQWDESNYDLSKAPKFVQDAYKNKKWAFVSDYARLDIIYQHGGVYLDTDVELIKNLDSLLKQSKAYMGFESDKYVNSGLGFGAEAHNFIIKEMMDYYKQINFDKDKLDEFACPIINTEILRRHGLISENTLQKIDEMTIYPTEYLCSKNIYTGKTKITENTYSIHHYSGTWLTKREEIRMKSIIMIKRILPNFVVDKIRKTIRKRAK